MHFQSSCVSPRCLKLYLRPAKSHTQFVVDNSSFSHQTYSTPPSISARQHRSCSSKPTPALRHYPRARTKQSLATLQQPHPEHRSPAHIYSPTSASVHFEPQPTCSESPS